MKVMILIIGETLTEFYPLEGEIGDEDCYTCRMGGSLLEAAYWLEDSGIKNIMLASKFSHDNIGENYYSALEDLGFDIAKLDKSPLLSPVDIIGDIRLRGTAASTITTEELTELLYEAKPDAIVLTSPLLSLNPSASNIVDSVLFFTPAPLIIVDLGDNPTAIVSLEILKDSLNKLATSDKAYCIGDAVESKIKKISRDGALEKLKSIK